MAAFVKASAYRVLVDFTDFKDGNKKYKAGDDFPVSTNVTRLKELLADDSEGRTDKLKGAPIIEAVEEETQHDRTGDEEVTTEATDEDTTTQE